MDIASLSVQLSQDRLAGEVGTRLLAMSLHTAEGEGASLIKLLGSTETVSDPALGNLLDTSA